MLSVTGVLLSLQTSLLGTNPFQGLIDKRATLAQQLHMNYNVQRCVRSEFLNAIGITETELRKQGPAFGPLDELKAANLCAGPFRVRLTDVPVEHLTFSGSHKQSSLRVLDIESIFRLYLPQRTRVAR